MKSRLIKILILWCSVVVVDICIFSPGILGCSLFSGSVLEILLAWVAAAATVILLTYGMWVLLSSNDKQTSVDLSMFVSKPASSQDLKRKLTRTSSKVFKSQLERIGRYIERLELKEKGMNEVLSKTFPENSMTWQKFHSGMVQAQQNVIDNLDSALERITVFDEKEYSLAENSASLNKNIEFVDHQLDDAKRILDALDRMQLELADLPYQDDEAREQESQKELDDLILSLKHYQ